jgi:hypothetical protein
MNHLRLGDAGLSRAAFPDGELEVGVALLRQCSVAVLDAQFQESQC